MKLQRTAYRKSKKKEYYSYIITIPSGIIGTLGWMKGDKLRIVSCNKGQLLIEKENNNGG